ncbi:MAG: hypothetical protein LBU91_09565 [Bacteroidales bacterium]|jgi:hypothetical protein|nr:hypothetical protein [Bacteroidales bacterium]
MSAKILRISVLVVIAGFLMISCNNLKNMVKKHPTDAEYVQTPNPMEMHGDKVKINVEGTYKPKYFHKKAGVFFQPELQYEGGTLLLKPIILRGESVQNIDGTTINNANGGKFTYTDEIPYKPEYKTSKLVVTPTVFQAKRAKDTAPSTTEQAAALKKSLPLSQKELAVGTNTTPNLADNTSAKPTFAKDNYKKPDNVFKTTPLFFVVDMSNLNMNLAANKSDAAKEAFAAMNQALKDSQEIASIKINGWASPEGELVRNGDLSNARSKTGEKFLRDNYKKVIDAQVKEYNKNLKRGEKRITAKDLTKELPITIEGKQEDWDGFMKNLQASNIADKDQMIRTISSGSSDDAKHKDINTMVAAYPEVEEQLLPPLRRAEIVIEQVVPANTNEEMAQLSTENPKELTVEELLFAATLTNDKAQKLQIYTNATQVYPEDWRGFNDVAFCEIENKNFDAADAALQKANTLSPNNAAVLNNLGVVALSKKDNEKAKQYFNDAKAKGNAEAGGNLAPILIQEGDYTAATAVTTGRAGDLNLALSQILSNDLVGAKQTLAAAENSPKANYLKAIVAAREDNANEIYANLKNTDADFKKQAQTDIEFRKYVNEIEFTNATK